MTDNAVALARRAYEAIEPFHVVAYFNPGLGAAAGELGIDPFAFYVGARGAPLGQAHAAVVTAAFYNFAPARIGPSWQVALAAGLAEIDQQRYLMLGEQYRQILAGVITDADIAALAADVSAFISTLPLAGRTLAAAWAASEIPDEPVLALWRHTAVLREWRGDNHLAELIRHGLSGLEAGVLHEADLPDPTVRRRILGRKFFRLSRGWSEERWGAAVDSLTARGLVEGGPEDHRLTSEGMALYLDIEAGTDAISATAFDAEAAALIERIRPIGKAVIDAGILPGTKQKHGKN